MSPLHSDLAERIERVNDCWGSVMKLFAQYHQACAGQEWEQADHVRTILIETVDGALDATAAVFKRFQDGQKDLQ